LQGKGAFGGRGSLRGGEKGCREKGNGLLISYKEGGNKVFSEMLEEGSDGQNATGGRGKTKEAISLGKREEKGPREATREMLKKK